MTGAGPFPGELEAPSAAAHAARELRMAGWGVAQPESDSLALPAGVEAGRVAALLRRRGVDVRTDSAGVAVVLPSPEAAGAFLASFFDIAAGLDPAAWLLPTGEQARRVQAELDRLEDARRRLAAHVALEHVGLTAPDQPSGEQWDSGQVWAHLAEFGSYWLHQLEVILSGAGEEPVPFGRTKADLHRIEMIAAHRGDAVTDLWSIVEGDIRAVGKAISELGKTDWERVGRHPTLGDMSLWDFGDHFTVGHYVEHADQLDELIEEVR